MASSSRKRHSVGHRMGEPAKRSRQIVKNFRLRIPDFRHRIESSSESIRFPINTAHGCKWRIEIFPREGPYIRCFVRFAGYVDDGCHVYRNCAMTYGFKQRTLPAFCMQSFYYLRRQVLNSGLEPDGSLRLEVDICSNERCQGVWYPKQLRPQDALVEIYQDADSQTSDVAFSVGGTVYRVHKNILAVRCKHLYDLATRSGDSDQRNSNHPNAIRIDGVEAGIFKRVLDFVYTVRTPEIEDEKTATDLLVASDRFHCIQLKLYVESVLVDRFLKASNAAAMLILGDSRSCALLKEAAIGAILRDPAGVKLSREDFLGIHRSDHLVGELLHTALFPGGDGDPLAGNLESMSVARLRQTLEGSDLALDGSREVLVRRLHTHYVLTNQWYKI